MVDQFTATIGAIVAGISVFGGLVVVGGVIVRRLNLPNDPPDDARFSLPPPPARKPGDAGDPVAIAAEHAAINAHGAALRSAYNRLLAVAERTDEAEHAPIDLINDELETLTLRWRERRTDPSDTLAGLVARIEALERELKPETESSQWRLLILFLVLVGMLAFYWLVIRQPAG